MDTFGWDVICACSGDKLNDLLAAQFKKSPASLSYDDNSGTSIKAQFEPWRIVAGGSIKKIHMELPIKSGSLTSPLSSNKLDGAVITVEIELAFIKDANASKSNLQFNFKHAASNQGDTTDGSIFIVNADTTGVLKRLDPTGNLAMNLHDIVPQCLIANKDKLAYIFTTLNLTPAGDGSWLAPKSPNYVYVQSTGSDPGYLAVFSMLSDKDTSNLELKVDPSLCNGKHDAYIAFSKHVFLEHVIMPKLHKSYLNGDDVKKFFMMSGDKIVYEMFMFPLKCHPVKVSLTHYYPILTSLEVGISANEIKSSADGYFDITGLAKSYVTFSETQKIKCSFDKSTGGLSMKADGDPVTDYDKHIPWYLYVAALPFLPFLGPIILGIVVAVVDSVIAAVSTSVANKTSSEAGNLALGKWSAVSIEWPGSDKWKIEDGGLSDSFYMRCKLEKTT